MSLFVLVSYSHVFLLYFFFFNYTATTEIYTLSLHDALPISVVSIASSRGVATWIATWPRPITVPDTVRLDCKLSTDRKSTRLNSSHRCISYAVFCLKKKKRRN